MEALVAIGEDVLGLCKRSHSALFRDSLEVPSYCHELIRMPTRVNCVICKGGRIGDRLRKRVALSKITNKTGRPSNRKPSIYGYKQY